MSGWFTVGGALLAVVYTAGGAGVVEPEFKGDGLCQFALHGFTLTPQSEVSINGAVQHLLEQHQLVFGFNRNTDFRLRMRVYGRFEDFTNYPPVRDFPNMQGVYVFATREIVTWRQEIPGFLGTTLLHEASHAIMHAHYRRFPLWLMEGVAEYFAYSAPGRTELNSRLLRSRWGRLNLWLRENKLPPLAPLVNATPEQWKKMDLEQAYAVSWSLFQFLMSTDANQRLVKRMLAEWQEAGWRGPECSEQLDRLYPGGFKSFETAWHHWIDPTGEAESYKDAFKGNGICRFAVAGMHLAPALEKSINQQVRTLYEKHCTVFGLRPNPDFHLRVRIFGDAGSYGRFTTNWMVSGFEVKPGDLARMDGYYTPLSREIVALNHGSPEQLTAALVELANMAILREHFPKTPQWVHVGSLHQFVAAPRQGHNERQTLAKAWQQSGLSDSSLPLLGSLLRESPNRPEAEEPERASQSKVLCWALFQFFSGSEPNRQVLRDLMKNLQATRGRGVNSASEIASLYPGGWAGFEAGFKHWASKLGQ